MEGFLQSLKVKNIKRQQQICLLSGVKAKNAPNWYEGIGWRITGNLYWNGKVISRFSYEYQCLLDRAYFSLYKNENFRIALKDSTGYELCHSIGKQNTKRTILTEYEFVSRLNKLRNQI